MDRKWRILIASFPHCIQVASCQKHGRASLVFCFWKADFPLTFPCFFFDATWMQCGKLTIRIFLFPSIQKNLYLHALLVISRRTLFNLVFFAPVVMYLLVISWLY